MHVNPSQLFQANAMANSSGKEPPAKAAHTFLESNGDWANQPFGKLVSLFARGEEIPASPDANSAGPVDLSQDVAPDTTETIGQS